MRAWLNRQRSFVVGTAFGSVIGTVVGICLTVAAAFVLAVEVMNASVDGLVVPGQGCFGRTLTAEEYAQTARHEIGHAVVALTLEPGWFVRTDVYPSGVMVDDDCASGVTTIQFPASLTRTQLVESIAMEYGGYVIDLAEDGQPNSGASRDISIATSRAIVGVDSFGMGRRVRPYDWGLLAQQGFAADVEQARSEDVREMIDQGLMLAQRIVSENRDQIDALTQALVDSPNDGLDVDGIGVALTADIVFDPQDTPLPAE